MRTFNGMHWCKWKRATRIYRCGPFLFDSNWYTMITFTFNMYQFLSLYTVLSSLISFSFHILLMLLLLARHNGKYMLTNEKYDFPVFILVDGINMGEITRQIHPYTIDFMRITIVQSVITDAPQILLTHTHSTHKAADGQIRKEKQENKTIKT